MFREDGATKTPPQCQRYASDHGLSQYKLQKPCSPRKAQTMPLPVPHCGDHHQDATPLDCERSLSPLWPCNQGCLKNGWTIASHSQRVVSITPAYLPPSDLSSRSSFGNASADPTPSQGARLQERKLSATILCAFARFHSTVAPGPLLGLPPIAFLCHKSLLVD